MDINLNILLSFTIILLVSLFEINAADSCENPCHDNHLKGECKGIYDDDKQLAQHYASIFFGNNEKDFLRNLSGINIIIWHRNIDYKLTNKSEWNKNSQKFRVWALEIWEKMEDEFDKHYCYFFDKDVNIENLKSISKKVPKLFENIFDIITGLNNKASIKINKDVEGSTFKENFKNKLRSLNDDLYKKMDEENDIEYNVERISEARYSIFVQLLQNGDLDSNFVTQFFEESTFNNQQLYSRIEETFGSKYSQEIAIRIVEQSQAKLNLELEGKSDSKKEAINEVEEIMNEMGIIDNDKKDISSSRNSNKRSRKNLSKKQKKHVEANKVNIVENTKQYLESDVEDNTNNNQSLNNEISESFHADKNFNEDNVENDEDNEGWVLNKKDEIKLRKEGKKKKEEEEKLKRLNKLKGKDIVDKTSFSFNNIKKMNFKEFYDAEMKKKNILNNESIIDNKIKINDDLEKIENSKQIKDKKLFVNPEISFKEILDKKDSRNELTGNNKLKEENKEGKCEKEDKFKSAEEDDKALVSSNKIVNSSNISPFTPINYLEEDALNERFMRFISSNEDPRKIIPSLDLGVIVYELNKHFKHFQKIRMKNNCHDKNVNLTFGEFQ
uniref:Uncharacterized protein n=1 Tax=Meloidogyne floridensis TaxID=298350 RepID=A0A915NRG0_9BILA